MALLDVFKKKKKEPSLRISKKVKEEKKEIEKIIEKPKTTTLPPPEGPKRKFGREEGGSESRLRRAPIKKERKIVGKAYQILRIPHVTEKATDLTKQNQYVFKIYPRANKTEVKKAVEDVFKVNVVSVKIINVPKKKRRLGKVEGERPGYKKAIVKIKEGQKIEVLPR